MEDLKASLYQLADDTWNYGEKANWWLLVSPNGEDEYSEPFPTEGEARFHAHVNGWMIVPLDE